MGAGTMSEGSSRDPLPAPGLRAALASIPTPTFTQNVPWTFAHPAAVLPFRKIGQFRLPLAALVIGSIAPDLGYYVGQFRLATFAHSTIGVILVCLPTGALVLALFSVIQPALIQLLPHPHRHAIVEALRARCYRAKRSQDLALAAMGLIVGAGTHTVWDSFTHATGFAVQWMPVLQTTLFEIGSRQMHVYSLFQHASTLIGVGVLVVTYCRWLRSQQPVPAATNHRQERLRYVVLIGCFACACAVGVLGAGASADSRPDGGGLDVFRMVILATNAFAALLVVSALAWRRCGDA